MTQHHESTGKLVQWQWVELLRLTLQIDHYFWKGALPRTFVYKILHRLPTLMRCGCCLLPQKVLGWPGQGPHASPLEARTAKTKKTDAAIAAASVATSVPCEDVSVI
eukprot:155298-Amphidinium_carterae.1